MDRPTTDQTKTLELSHQQLIVFFDGVCGLCNGVVTWLIDHDPSGRFRFAPLQGETARAILSDDGLKNPPADLDSVVLLVDGVKFERADAALRILSELGGWWALAARAGRLVPRPVRDGVYRYIARHRYQWFGKAESCRIPTPSERARFLD